MTDGTPRCTATSKHTGKRCRQPAVPGSNVCRYHGAGGGAPKGNLNRLVHGAYAARVLNGEERRIHDAFLERLREDFELNASSDEVAAQMAAMAFLQYVRAQKAEKEAAAAAQARIVRNCLRDLKATKGTRERGGVPLGTTPAEWAAAAVVGKLREAEKGGTATTGTEQTKAEPVQTPEEQEKEASHGTQAV
jgi:hypothetical protein